MLSFHHQVNIGKGCGKTYIVAIDRKDLLIYMVKINEGCGYSRLLRFAVLARQPEEVLKINCVVDVEQNAFSQQQIFLYLIASAG